MARKRIEDETPAFTSWDDVDQALAIIGDNLRSIEAIEAKMQENIDNEKTAAELQARTFIENNARMERQIKLFAEDHREDMDGKKTKTLNFGSLGFRKSTKITLPKAGAKLAEMIRQLVDRGMGDCVVQKAPTVDKDALRKYPTDDIVAVGGGIKIDDVFWYEPDRERIERG